MDDYDIFQSMLQLFVIFYYVRGWIIELNAG
jgi:hypothetical protein